jgi:hypothetical protein
MQQWNTKRYVSVATIELSEAVFSVLAVPYLIEYSICSEGK